METYQDQIDTSYSKISTENILSDFDTPTWYLLKSKPRGEFLANHSLSERGVQTYLPKLLKKKPGLSELESMPLFPGYLFFQIAYSSQLWAYIRWAPGVAYILKDDEGPLPLPPILIQEIKTREERKRLMMLDSLNQPFKRDEQLRVIDGPLSGLDVVFDRPLSAAGRSQILVEILGKITRVSINSASLMRLE